MIPSAMSGGIPIILASLQGIPNSSCRKFDAVCLIHMLDGICVFKGFSLSRSWRRQAADEVLPDTDKSPPHPALRATFPHGGRLSLRRSCRRKAADEVLQDTGKHPLVALAMAQVVRLDGCEFL